MTGKARGPALAAPRVVNKRAPISTAGEEEDGKGEHTGEKEGGKGEKGAPFDRSA